MTKRDENFGFRLFLLCVRVTQANRKRDRIRFNLQVIPLMFLLENSDDGTKFSSAAT
jgi:hypothetical protein